MTAEHFTALIIAACKQFILLFTVIPGLTRDLLRLMYTQLFEIPLLLFAPSVCMLCYHPLPSVMLNLFQHQITALAYCLKI
jgi:hypothetical protein